MDFDDEEAEKQKKAEQKRLQEEAEAAAARTRQQQQDDYNRTAQAQAEATEPATPPPEPEKPKDDEYGRRLIVQGQGGVTMNGIDDPGPVSAVQSSPAQTSPALPGKSGGEVLRQYFQACQDNDATAATKLADENHFTPAALRHGINMLVITHQNYEGAGGLLSKCGLAGASGVDAGFMNDLLDRTTDKERAVGFLQGMGATFNDEHMMKIQSTNPADAVKIIKAGQFDATENGSRCLLHAAGDGQKSVFNALMEAGANPLTAIQQGSNDPRNEGMYETATKWAGEFYKAHPEMTPPKQGPVSLEAVAERKISQLAPSVGKR